MRNWFVKTLVACGLLFGIASIANAQSFAPCDSRTGCSMQGHIFYYGPPPVVTGTGTPSIATGSSNVAGVVTAGASATSVVITFAAGGYSSVPFCIVGSQTQVAAFQWVTTATAITITQTATSGNKINYRCDPSS